MCSTAHFCGGRRNTARGLRFLPRWIRLVAVVSAVAALSSCASTGGAGGEPDPAWEAQAVQQTVPQQRLQITFDWDMRDRDARFNGQGVVRLDRDYRVRVDLFGPRGETYSAAIVEGEQMRVVPAGSDALLPPPALLWSVLGVFRPPVDAPLTGTSHANGRTTLDYSRDGVNWRFRFENEQLRGTEWTTRGGRRTVELTGAAAFGLPGQASFRDWTEFRELTLRVTNVEQATGFGADVWVLPGGY